MEITIGQTAPGFTLYNSEKNTVSLVDFAGKKNVLLLFFPLAFTSTCTKQLCDVRDDTNTYENEHVQVLAISVDSAYTLAKFKAEQHYNYPLLSDFNREVSGLYETIYASFGAMDMKGVSKRSAFIIDKQGIVQYAEVLENASDVPDAGAIRLELGRLSTL
ncbi:MAG: redoxin domain-containing protein [Ferruginibacter sp.]